MIVLKAIGSALAILALLVALFTFTPLELVPEVEQDKSSFVGPPAPDKSDLAQ